MNAIQQKNPLVALSEQELIDCCSPANEGALQCWGHGPNMAWNFLINNTHGMDATEASYPYNLHSRKGNNNQTWWDLRGRARSVHPCPSAISARIFNG